MCSGRFSVFTYALLRTMSISFHPHVKMANFTAEINMLQPSTKKIVWRDLGSAAFSDRWMLSLVAHSAARLHSARLSSTNTNLFVHFWISQDSGGVRPCQHGDYQEPPTERHNSSTETYG